MFSRFRFQTPVFKNTGSVARDHLASERTFLAWIRTGLGFVALGIAIERFSQLDLSALLQQGRDSSGRRGGDIDHSKGSNDNHNDNNDAQEREGQTLLVGSLLGLGSGSIVYGAARYFSNLRQLESGHFKPAYHGPAFLAASVAGLAGGLYGSALKRARRERLERAMRENPRPGGGR